MKGFFHEIYHNREKPMSTKFVKTVDIVFHQFVQICSKNLDAGILPMTQFLTKKKSCMAKKLWKLFSIKLW